MSGLLSWKGERRKGRDIKGEGESERERKGERGEKILKEQEGRGKGER